MANKVSDRSKETEIPMNEFNDLNKSGSDVKQDDKKKQKTKEKTVSLFQLFRFATKLDVLMLVIGTLGSIGSGAGFPIMLIFFSNILDSFSGNDFDYCNITLNGNETEFEIPKVLGTMSEQAIYLCILAVASLILSYFQVAFWMMPAERQTRRIRKTLFKSILRQDIGWFDEFKDGSLTNRLTDDVNKIKDGINDKVGSAIQFISTFFSGLIISFIRGWQLTLIILALSPFLFAAAVVFTMTVTYLTQNELNSYAKAGSIAEEAISSIRTVFAFNGAQKEHKRYEVKLEEARKSGIKKAMFTGTMFGLIWFLIQCSYAVGFWFGWVLSVKTDEYTVGKVLLVFFSIIMAIFSLGNAGPFIGNISTARGAAYKVFEIIDRKPVINSESDNGETPSSLTGNIEFKNVEFNYPSRKEIKILDKLSLTIKAGQTVALVGASGSGKSTCIQLLQRFYDPLDGAVLIDGRDLRNLNVNWLRTQLGVVNQEPVLFGLSIIENIRFGREGVTDEEIIEAAKAANAHRFIIKLPEKYNTLVGDRGSQLSGGQKQRIAIARALVRNPKILLLDEATSALDNQSEAVVQEALDQARLGRTTIVVAHRLTTIRNADVIYVLDHGKLVESGTHEELMKKQDAYFKLVTAQQMGGHEKDDKKFKKELAQMQSMDDDEIFPEQQKEQPINEKIKTKVKVKDPSMGRLFMLNKPEWGFIIIGCIASIISGAVQPAFSIVFSKVIAVFGECDEQKQKEQVIIYCILFVVFGVITLFSNFFQNFMFGLSGENLTKRVRSMAFKAMLTQEVGWYDIPENNVGTLTTRLAVEAAAIQGATGVRIGGVLMNIGNFGIGLVLAFVYGWAITLIILAFVPFLIIGGVFQTKMMVGFANKDKKNLEEAGKLTNEAISNIRTVAILNKEKHFIKAYSDKIDIPFKGSMKSANLYGFMLGVTNSIVYFATAAAFVAGAYFVDEKLFGMNFERIMLVFGCIIFGAQSVGQASSLMPDYAKAKVAATKIFDLFDRVPKINNWNNNDGMILPSIDGEISFKSVEFSYPTRSEVKVLNGLNLTIFKGQRIALVGSSGCGKSTVTQLLERFYDPDSGEITINNVNIQNINLQWLRSQIGIVSQEPILFDASIRENIAYGDNTREVSMEEIINAAKQANIHDFISNLPHAYETNVGAKGTQLSGGQKQRVSIARALVKNPRILLLDEATSALDTESEKIVQEALERAQKGRTSIVIAHRLSTIKNSDLILVIDNGNIIEAGNHDQLIRLNGFYAKLNNKKRSDSELAEEAETSGEVRY